jgi:peptidoglycan/xylan/chitin deacetylase (PgdA/CDA1 family)
MPGRFGIAKAFGPSYSLRCVVFHDISFGDSPFTRGMGVSITPAHFEAVLEFLTRHYNPVRLQDVLADSDGRGLPPRPVLVTFDDGYASVMEWGAPLCNKLGVPAIFFLNAAFLDNHRLAPDNLVCFVANVLGMVTINAAVRAVKGANGPKLQCLAEVFSDFFPAISLAERNTFLNALADLGGINERQLAEEAKLYLTRYQICRLVSTEFEIGNHTYTHVRCRSLAPENLAEEIDRNKAVLEATSGSKVRSFSVPYGSSEDLTSDLVAHLKLSGHEVAFLSESLANFRGPGRFQIDRVSARSDREATLFLEIEVLPRLRTTRNRLYQGLASLRRGPKHASLSQFGAPRGRACSATVDRTDTRM